MRWGGVLLGVVAVAGCLGDDPAPVVSATPTDGGAGQDAGADAPSDAGEDGPDAPSGPCDPASPFGAPEPVTELNDPVAGRVAARLTPDMKGVFLATTAADGGTGRDLFRAGRTDVAQPFGALSLVVATETALDEGKPSLDPAGQRLYFHRNTAADGTDYDLWYAPAEGSTGDFGPPVRVDALSQVGTFDGDPYVPSDGASLWFTSNRGGSLALYVATKSSGEFGAPALVEGLPSGGFIDSPVASEDGRVLYFGYEPPGDAAVPGAVTDIWIATRAQPTGAFQGARKVEELASGARDEPSWLSADGCTLYMFSNRSARFEIYRARKR